MVVIAEEVLDTTFDKNIHNIDCYDFFEFFNATSQEMKYGKISKIDTKGIIILLKKDEKLSDFIDQIDINVEKLGISFERGNEPLNGDITPLDLSNVDFSRFPNLKSLEIRWRHFGINNKSLSNCKKLELLFFGSPIDDAFETDASAFYTLDNLKVLSRNGWGIAYLGKKFEEFIKTERENRKIMYNFIC